MIKLPDHVGAIINHNEHKLYYDKIERFIVDNDLSDCFDIGDMDEAIEKDELWTIQLYPNTPVGFNIVAGSTLEKCLRRINDL